MNILYIGQYGAGTTSRTRGGILREALNPHIFNVIDTQVEISGVPKLFRSIGFRYKLGPMLERINRGVVAQCRDHYDMIWVDKAVFLYLSTVKWIRHHTKLLVHYTPDTAFYENRSIHFYKSIDLYDYLITTKSFEKHKYLQFVPSNKLILSTQGFNSDTHFPRYDFSKKKDQVIFVGLYEKARGAVISHLILNNINVVLAGEGWKAFVIKNRSKYLRYLGKGIWANNYAEAISLSRFGLGLLSNRFPELHTTRTFEIPACGTALLTEKNHETQRFFADEDVIFYNSPEDLVNKIRFFNNRADILKTLSDNGHTAVHRNGYDYQTIIRNILKQIMR